MQPEIQLGSWSISSYFLILSLDFCLLLFWIKYRSMKKGLHAKLALDVGIISSIFGLIGARVFHIFYEQAAFYSRFPIEAIKLWQGGFVILPGLASGIIAGVFYLKIKKQPVLLWLDFYSPVLSLGYLIGRWACFLQGCCYGHPTESQIGFHFQILKESGEEFARLPTQLFASFGELFVLAILLLLEKNEEKFKLGTGVLFSIWLFGHGLNRVIMEVFRDDPRGQLLLGFGISFWVSIVMIVMGTVIWRFRSKTSSP